MRARGVGPNDRQRPAGITGRAGGRSGAATRTLLAPARPQWRRPETSPIEARFWDRARPLIPELQREVAIGPYRVDFLVPSKKLVIELYGYKWHASQEKRISDARRERDLMRMGYRLMSFMGAEVTRDVDGCVRQTLQVLLALDDPTVSLPATPQRTVTVAAAAPVRQAGPAPGQRQSVTLPRRPPSLATPPKRSSSRYGLSTRQIVILVTLSALFVFATVALGALVGLAAATLA